jgi:hypothetical protein
MSNIKKMPQRRRGKTESKKKKITKIPYFDYSLLAVIIF